MTMVLPPKISMEAARVNAGMLQKDVADALSITPSTLRSWEKGESVPDYDKAIRLSELYNYPADYIFFGKRQLKVDI